MDVKKKREDSKSKPLEGHSLLHNVREKWVDHNTKRPNFLRRRNQDKLNTVGRITGELVRIVREEERLLLVIVRVAEANDRLSGTNNHFDFVLDRNP